MLKDLTCPSTPELACKLTGFNLFLVESVSSDPQFKHPVQVPDGFPGYATASVMDGEENPRLPLVQLSLLALGLGVITGFGAVLFRDLIGLIHNLLFAGHAVIHYDANVFTAPAPWGPLVILVPVLGAVGVTFLVTNFAPEAKGHGVPEVMDAIYYKGGVIRPVVALVKSLSSAIAIGSGASVGREGPIIQIGSALGSTLADYSHAGGPANRSRSLPAPARASQPPSILLSAG